MGDLKSRSGAWWEITESTDMLDKQTAPVEAICCLPISIAAGMAKALV
jgi:hypothetical protein